MPKTIRVTLATCSSEHLNPADGSHRFPAGSVVDLDDETAGRWVRNGFAVEWHGKPGGTVSDEEAAMSDASIDAEIARLLGIKEARLAVQEAAPTGGVAGLPEDQPLGDTPYQDRRAPHPLAEYGLTPQQVANLERAGFGRPDLIRRARDEDLLEVPGVGVATLGKLRG